jgi:hypothetical protein
MDTRAFLEAVWPAQGTYCLATPYTPPNAAPTYAHTIVHSIAEAVRAIELNRSKVNLFFCVHTLASDKVWNPNKLDPRTKKPGAFEKRTHANMKEARCFFFDLDVGESTATCPKYPTRQEALDGLDQFLFRTRLPDPLVTSSGGGYHVYWRLSQALGSPEWRGYATALHAVARREGLRADPARTNDQASVLRVVGTSNLKPGREPRPCVAIQEGVETSTGSFLGQLRELVGVDIQPAVAHQPQQGNLAQGWDGPSATLDELKGLCEHVRDYCDRPVGERGEPILYHIGCGLIPLLEDGDDWFHELASRHPDYGDPDKTAAKLDQYIAVTGGIPPNCATLDAKCGGDNCARCQNAKLGKNPLLIASALRKKTALPPPTLSLALASTQPVAIVAPPFPYRRTAEGIFMTKVSKDKDGNEVSEDIRVLPYDCFPFEDCRRTDLERAFTLWAFEVPHEGQVVVKISSASMQDVRALHAQLYDYGIKCNRFEVEKLSMFMNHYGRTLQEKLAASRQYDHLGWADAKHTEFIMPNVLLKTDGTTKPCVMSAAVRDVSAHIHTAGTMADQIEALRFYADDKYFRHQFVVLCALAAPAFHATDFFGCVVNAAGESGGGKSSAVFTGAGLWGSPRDYTVNGAGRLGASLLGQQQKVFTLANLPYCIDEITNTDDDKIRDFCLASSQATEPDKLKNDGTPRPKRETFKSTIYLASSNKSFHNLLGQGAEMGGASAMRVFELWFEKFVDGAAEAKAQQHAILHNYGWVGPAALERYIKHRDYIDGCIRQVMTKIDAKYALTGPERFWSAVMAAVLVYGEFAASFGLVPYDIARLREWLLNVQLPAMRGAIKLAASSQTPADLLGAFMNDNQAKIILTNSDVVQQTQFSVTDPRGELVGEYDRAMSLIYIRRDVFRKWLTDRKQNAVKVICDLRASGGVSNVEVQRVLGEGTLYARLKVSCLVVDMTKVSVPCVLGAAPASNVIPLRKGVKA